MVTGLRPTTRSWIMSFLENVVFPDEEGPAIRTTFTWSRSALIRSAISAIFLSCRASAVCTKSWIPPSRIISSSLPTHPTRRTLPQFLYSL